MTEQRYLNSCMRLQQAGVIVCNWTVIAAALGKNRLAAVASLRNCPQKFESLTKGIDGSVQVSILAFNLDIGFVHSPRVDGWL